MAPENPSGIAHVHEHMTVPIARRDLLRSLGLVAGTLLVSMPGSGQGATIDSRLGTDGEASFGAMLAITPDGQTILYCPSSEMGQGTQESLARMIGEELDCDWESMRIILPWADPKFANPVAKAQLTANSATITGYYQLLRETGAVARAMLIAAAAQRWGMQESELKTSSGRVRHPASNRELGYGTLAADAARLPVPAVPTLKPVSDFRLIGARSPRKDLLPKVTGKAEFGIDVDAPDLLNAALIFGPHPEATFTPQGMDVVKASPGVVAIVPIKGGYAVVADKFWRARKAAAKLTLTIDSSPITGLDDAAIRAKIDAALDLVKGAPFPDFDLSISPPKIIPADSPAVQAAFAAAPRRIEARYDVPYLAHATMEPLCCAARFKDGTLLIRGPLQAPEAARKLAASTAGLPLEQVRVEVTFLGGGFGRKWSTDFIVQTVQTAMGVPGHMVKLIWTREQDFAWDQYRPAYAAKSEAAIAPDGSILAMRSRIAGQSITGYLKRPRRADMADGTAAMLLIYGAYAFPNKEILFHEADLHIPVGFWRSVAQSQNAFFAESFIDEIARATGKDPYHMRRDLIGPGYPRLRAVLDKAAAMIGWDKPRAKGIGRGIAIGYADSNYCAQAVEVEVTDKALSIRRIVCAFDCGLMIDPVSVEAQISGGIIFGLQAALWGEMPFADGRPVADNFSSYRMPMLADIPPIEVALMPGADTPGSAGEAGTPPIAPALANAIADAGGPRVRRLPLSRSFDL